VTRNYWLFIFLGYGLIISVALLGVVNGLEAAIFLVLVERFGKALRSPSRDAVLTIVSGKVGAGKAFGLHELMDQIGAIVGPLLVAALMFSTGNNYRYTFSFLFIPFLLLLAALVYAYRKTKDKIVAEQPTAIKEKARITRPFYVYSLAVLLNSMGLIPFSLILFRASEILRPMNQDWIVPLIYVLIQGVDAPAALLSGYAFDKSGISILLLPFALSLFPPLFAMFDAGLAMLIVASVFFGVVLGMQESIYRAAVSTLTPLPSRGTAYGIFNTAYGVGLIVGGAVYGAMLTYGLPYAATVIYVVVMQAAAVACLLDARAGLRKQNVSEEQG
jgi:MFS family permease